MKHIPGLNFDTRCGCPKWYLTFVPNACAWLIFLKRKLYLILLKCSAFTCSYKRWRRLGQSSFIYCYSPLLNMYSTVLIEIGDPVFKKLKSNREVGCLMFLFQYNFPYPLCSTTHLKKRNSYLPSIYFLPVGSILHWKWWHSWLAATGTLTLATF